MTVNVHWARLNLCESYTDADTVVTPRKKKLPDAMLYEMGMSTSCPSLSAALAGGYDTTVPINFFFIVLSIFVGHVRLPCGCPVVSPAKRHQICANCFDNGMVISTNSLISKIKHLK